jgi:hypothetical protein
VSQPHKSLLKEEKATKTISFLQINVQASSLKFFHNFGQLNGLKEAPPTLDTNILWYKPSTAQDQLCALFSL